STKDFMRCGPSAKIQNTESVTRLSAPESESNGIRGETQLAPNKRRGIRREPVSATFHERRFVRTETTRFPGYSVAVQRRAVECRNEQDRNSESGAETDTA